MRRRILGGASAMLVLVLITAGIARHRAVRKRSGDEREIRLIDNKVFFPEGDQSPCWSFQGQWLAGVRGGTADNF